MVVTRLGVVHGIIVLIGIANRLRVGFGVVDGAVNANHYLRIGLHR